MACGNVFSPLGRTEKEWGVSEQASKGGQWCDACMGEEQSLWDREDNTSPLSGTSVTNLGILCAVPEPEVLKED